VPHLRVVITETAFAVATSRELLDGTVTMGFRQRFDRLLTILYKMRAFYFACADEPS